MTAMVSLVIGSLAWLTGCWVDQSGQNYETWSEPYGSYLFAHAASLSGDDKVVFFEHLRIEPGEDGARYVAYPAGKSPTTFNEVARGENFVRFENASHDYPQRIEYRRSDNLLIATISLADGGKAQAFEKWACAD